MNLSSRQKLILLLPVLAGISWGSGGTFVRILSAFGMNSLTILFSRTFPATIILLICILIYDRFMLRVRPVDLLLLVACALLGMLGLNICYNVAIVELSLSLAAVLLSMSPIFVLLIAAVAFHEKITRIKVICMGLAIVGCILVSGIIEGSSLKWSLYGILIGIGSAFFYALYGIFSKIAMNRGYHSLTITFYCLLIMTIVLTPVASFETIGSYIQAAPLGHCLFLLLPALLNSVLPYIFFNLAMTRAETGIVSILASGGEPAAATVFGIIFFQEVPTALTISGLVLSIVALAILLRKSE